MISIRKGVGCLAVLLLLGVSAWAQDSGGGQSSTGEEAAEAAADFGFGIGVGVQSFTDPESGDTETYQSLALKPDVAIGKLGIGLDVTVNYRFTGGEAGNEFEIREEDWVPDDETNFFELYLPKVQYVRWARKGDPLFVQLGALPSARLGNGFIVSGYANTLYRPERPLFGMQLDVDGRLFNFPYLGVETFAGNLAAFDLFGGRLFARPLADSDNQILKGLQVGTTFVSDQDPFYFYRKDPDADQSIVDDSAQVNVWGFDVRQPILSNDVLSLSAFGDFVQQDDASGGMVGVGGSFISILPYRAEIRVMGDNFVPQYFGPQYDLFRVSRYQVYSADTVVREAHAGWLASTGFSLLSNRISLNISMEGPFGNYKGVYPTLRGSFMLAQGLVPGLSLEANYVKEEITEPAEIFDPENAVIGAQVNYQTGPAVISLIYDLEYDPTQTDNTPWNVTTRLETSISLF